jgi:hypothetical protein
MTPDEDATSDAADTTAHPASGTGTTDPSKTELAPGEEPVVTGTLFLTLILLMIIGAIWVIVYARLLDR